MILRLMSAVRKLISLIAQKAYKTYEKFLLDEIKGDRIPKHVAIIMDGNRRYAEKLGEERYKGHLYGANVTRKVIEWCFEIGIKQLTLYTFSMENFKRDEEEKRNLFSILEEKLREIANNRMIHERGVRVKSIGNIELLPENLQSAIKNAEEVTKDHKNFNLYIAIAYSGRGEITYAARSIADKAERNEISVESIDEDMISRHLYMTNGNDNIPHGDVDLIIRTGGELRLSNFLPWQSIGNECAVYFCAPYWPSFRKIDLLRAIRTYQEREREKKYNTMRRAMKILNAYKNGVIKGSKE